MRNAVVNRELAGFSRFFQSNLRGQNRARIAHRDQKFRVWEPLGLASMFVEAALVLLAGAVLGRQDRGALERVRAFRLTPILERSLP